MKTVSYTSTQLLSCAKCNGDIIICVADTLTALNRPWLEGTVVSVTEQWDICGKPSYLYGFQYDEADLADPTYSLVSSDIVGVFCKGCLTDYIDSFGMPSMAFILALLAPYFDHICLVTSEAELIAALANVDCNHIVIGEAFTITANRTIPSTKSLTILNGCEVTTAGHTFSIEGPFASGIYPCFVVTNPGDVEFDSASVEQVYPHWWGAVGDGTTNDTAAINAALASLVDGGVVYFPTGRYLIRRGDGAPYTDNILYSNTTIRGAGPSTVMVGRNAAGVIPPANGGSQYYNCFQGTSLSNITVEKVHVEGFLCLLSTFTCTTVTVNDITSDGELGNVGLHLRDKSVYFSKSNDVKVLNSSFLNGNFDVYFGGTGSGANACGTCLVQGCFFEHNLAGGNFTCEFPVGIYVYYADKVVVSECRFKNIYSSVDNGTPGTGMGYGVYEGDGATNSLTVDSCVFEWVANGVKTAAGILIAQAIQNVVSNNVFSATADAKLLAAVYLSYHLNNQRAIVTGNTAVKLSTSTFSPAFMCYPSSVLGDTVFSNNIIRGWTIGIYAGLYAQSTVVDGNTCEDQDQYGIQVEGQANSFMRHTKICNNTVLRSGLTGIYIVSYVVGVTLIGNTVLDCNQQAAGGETGSGIRFFTYSYGSLIVGNIIGNTPYGGGHLVFGIANSNNVEDRIFKDIVGNNTFLDIADDLQYYRFAQAEPTNFLFDISKGDFILNTALDDGETPGWYCTKVFEPTLDANASNASLTVTVSDTTGMASGDHVILCKSSNPYSGDNYYNSADWHVDVIDAVTAPTTFTLTTGIPVGDGTYTAGVGIVRVARFKAAATIDA